jgi:hypothetical protein
MNPALRPSAGVRKTPCPRSSVREIRVSSASNNSSRPAASPEGPPDILGLGGPNLTPHHKRDPCCLKHLESYSFKLVLNGWTRDLRYRLILAKFDRVLPTLTLIMRGAKVTFSAVCGRLCVHT